MATIQQTQISPAVLKGIADGRSNAFRRNPTPETAGEIVGAVASSLARLFHGNAADILDAGFDFVTGGKRARDYVAAKAKGRDALDEMMDRVPPMKSGKKAAPTAPRKDQGWRSGAECLAPYGDDFYPATVVESDSKTAVVVWADNGKTANVPVAKLQPLVLQKGDKVYAPWSDGYLYRCTVSQVKGRQAVITWADNGKESTVPLADIRLTANAKKESQMAKAQTGGKAASKTPAAKPATAKGTTSTKSAKVESPAAKSAGTRSSGTKGATGTRGATAAGKSAARQAPAKAAPKQATAKAAKAAPTKAKAVTKTVPGTRGTSNVTVKKGGGRGPR